MSEQLAFEFEVLKNVMEEDRGGNSTLFGLGYIES